MARRPSRSLAARARKAQALAEPPIRFVAPHDDVTIMRTVAYKPGAVVDDPSPRLRREALARGTAVEVKRGE